MLTTERTFSPGRQRIPRRGRTLALTAAALVACAGTAAAAPSVAGLQHRIDDLKRQRLVYARRAERLRESLASSRSEVADLHQTVADLENELQHATKPDVVTLPATCPVPATPTNAPTAFAQIQSLYGFFPATGPYSASLYRSGTFVSYTFTYSP